jgi:hypothetical protein
MPAEVTCPFCEKPVDPGSRYTMQRCVGWQRIAGVRASGKHGGSDIVMRETRQEWAHASCVKLAREGLLNQGSLL